MSWTDKYAEVLIVAIILVLLGGMGAYAWAVAALERECLSLGYRDATFRFVGPHYCIRRTDQSDIVVPLDSARALARIPVTTP